MFEMVIRPVEMLARLDLLLDRPKQDIRGGRELRKEPSSKSQYLFQKVILLIQLTNVLLRSLLH
jgi:hypothetical protein